MEAQHLAATATEFNRERNCLVLRSGTVFNRDLCVPKVEKKQPVAQRTVYNLELSDKVAVNNSRKLLAGEISVNTIPLDGSVQLNLRVISFFGESRAHHMEKSAASGHGQSFWTDKEKNLLFTTFGYNFINTRQSLKLREVKDKCKTFLRLIYRCFDKSLEDSKIIISMYYCLRHLKKKLRTRDFLELAFESFGKLAHYDSYLVYVKNKN